MSGAPPVPGGSIAFERIDGAEPNGPFVFTCEHASNALPFGLQATAADRVLLDDHWGWDIGARDVTLNLVERLGGSAVLSRFSRLVADPNRQPQDPTFIVRDIDGQALSFNTAVDAAEHARRAAQLFDPFHAAIDDTLGRRVRMGPPVHLVAVHSFTPIYRGAQRRMEVGVLFDTYEGEAEAVRDALAAQGVRAVLNEPYTGKPPLGLIYSAQRHGTRHAVKYLELEIRQDLIRTAAAARQVASRIAVGLEAFRPPPHR